MAPFPRKCPRCRERALDRATERYETTVEHDGRTYHVAIPDLALLKCTACGNRILPEEADERVSAEFRRAAGFLAPEEIRAGRNRLGLTQKSLADQLGVAEATLSRWETGAQIQQRAFDRLLRAYFDLPELRSYLAVCHVPAAPAVRP